MKRTSKFRQTSLRNTCLGENVSSFNEPCFSEETQRKIIEASFGPWSEPMSADEAIKFINQFVKKDYVS